MTINQWKANQNGKSLQLEKDWLVDEKKSGEQRVEVYEKNKLKQDLYLYYLKGRLLYYGRH